MTFKRLTQHNKSGTLGIIITVEEAKQFNLHAGDHLWVDLRRILEDTRVVSTVAKQQSQKA